VDLAKADSDLNSAATIGLVTETINVNQEGFVTTNGIVRGINTTGSLRGETWADGDVLYLSPTTAGALTNVKPIAPQHLVVLGTLIYAHATQGKILVKIQNGYGLYELHDVLITTPLNNQVLGYESSTSLWKNASIATWLGYTPYNAASISGTSGTIALFGASNTLGDSIISQSGGQIITANATDTGEHFIIGGSARVNGTQLVTGAATFSSTLQSGHITSTAGIVIAANNNLTWGGLYGAGIATLTASSTNGFQFYPTGSTGGMLAQITATGLGSFNGGLTTLDTLSWGTAGNKYMYGAGGTQKFAYTIAQHNIVYSGGSTGFSVYDSTDSHYIIRAVDSGNVSVKGLLNTNAGTIYAKASGTEGSGTEGSGYQLNAITMGYDSVNGLGWITAGGAAARTELYLNKGGGGLVYTGANLYVIGGTNYLGGTNTYVFGDNTDLYLGTGGSARLTITSSGAATFSGSVAIGNTVASAVAVASTHKVTVVIGGVTYYLLATNV
jgi:hypothetical protein